jgi:hypothetical protein
VKHTIESLRARAQGVMRARQEQEAKSAAAEARKCRLLDELTAALRPLEETDFGFFKVVVQREPDGGAVLASLAPAGYCVGRWRAEDDGQEVWLVGPGLGAPRLDVEAALEEALGLIDKFIRREEKRV